MDQNRISHSVSAADYGRMTATLVSAYVRRNNVPASDLPALIARAADALIGLGVSDGPAASAARETAQAEIRRSITREALISFEDGKGYKTLKRHLTACGLTPETYRAKWGLPRDYPMVAPGYSERRLAIATSLQIRNGNQGNTEDRGIESLAGTCGWEDMRLFPPSLAPPGDRHEGHADPQPRVRSEAYRE